MYFPTVLSVACLIAAAVAQGGSNANPPTVPSDYSVTAGQPSTFTWKPTTQGPVTLTLRSGAASDLNKGTVIASSIQNSGSYTFTLPADTTRNSDYTIEISVDGDSDPDSMNYTAPFVVESKNTVQSITASSSASVTASMTTASSASSASSATSASSASSASSSTNSMSSSATSASSTATAKSATKSSSSATGSSSASATATASSSTTSSTVAASTAAKAPSSGTSKNAVRNIQESVVAFLLGIVAVY